MSDYQALSNYLVELHKQKASLEEHIKTVTVALHSKQEHKDEIARIAKEG